jgi:hypothetical protein
MNSKIEIKSLVIFVAFTIVGVCMVAFGQGAAQAAISATLPLLGTALFAAGLTTFLVVSLRQG